MNTTIINASINDIGKANYALQMYGSNITMVSQESCKYLYETLLDNYPCMKGGLYCTPFGTTQGVFIFWMLVFGLLLVWVTYYLTKRYTK